MLKTLAPHIQKHTTIKLNKICDELSRMCMQIFIMPDESYIDNIKITIAQK